MDKIFIGLVFVFFDINILFIIVNINLLPNFIGYILICLGIKELGKHIKISSKLILIANINLAISISMWCIEFFCVDINNKYIYIIQSITYILFNFILYQIIKIIKDKEKKDERKYGTKLLDNSWLMLNGMILLNVLGNTISPKYNMMLLIGYIITSLIFLIAFARTKSIYNSYN